MVFPIALLLTKDDSPILISLLNQFRRADEIVTTIQSSNVKGYITSRPRKDSSMNDAVGYDEFMPFQPTNLPSDTSVLEFDSVHSLLKSAYAKFNIAIDTFFSHAEATKLLTKHIQAQNIATSRLTTARTEHENRLSSLRSMQEQHILKATLIEMNLERVEEAIRSVNGLVARGMDWGDIERLIETERTRGNPVAEIIEKCMFKEEKLVLGLREDDEEEEESGNETDEEEKEDKDNGAIVAIEVDLKLSGWANAREYFDKKKVAAEKVIHFILCDVLFEYDFDCRNRGRHNHRPGRSRTLSGRLPPI
jgi:predicted ribosome quality control (RQC) complex YloA/Tae2 family protein